MLKASKLFVLLLVCNKKNNTADCKITFSHIVNFVNIEIQKKLNRKSLYNMVDLLH